MYQKFIASLKNENSGQFPITLSPGENCIPAEFAALLKNNRSEINSLLCRSGALLFTGLPIHDRASFEECIKDFGQNFNGYIDGNSPRTKMSDIVYTSTEYDPGKSITMHNELSYSAKWPSKIFFSCIRAAETGGETPLADGRLILEKMDRYLVDKIRAEGIVYYRNLHGGFGFGPSWQDTFETENETDVINFCNNSAIEYSWNDDGGLRLIQKRKGVLNHPLTGEEVWFNQLDQFHPFHLGENVYNMLMDIYPDHTSLPTYVTFGDGSPVDTSCVEKIKNVFDAHCVNRLWNNGDLLLLDNVLVSHGRKPFTGDRKVLVAMFN